MMLRLCWTSFFAAALPHITAQHVSHSTNGGRPTCTVHAGSSNTTDDVPSIVEAFNKCGQGGNIVFPKNETYHINSRLNPVVNDVNIDWSGEWVVSYYSFSEYRR